MLYRFYSTDHVQQLFGGGLLSNTENSEGFRTGSAVHRHPVLLGRMLLLRTEQLFWEFWEM